MPEPQPWFSDGEPIQSPLSPITAVLRSRSRIQRLRAFVLAVIVAISVADIIVGCGLVLVARGCYLIHPAAGWAVPGLILLWYGLPQRPRFLAPKPPMYKTRPRRQGVRDGRS